MAYIVLLADHMSQPFLNSRLLRQWLWSWQCADVPCARQSLAQAPGKTNSHLNR